MARSNRERNEIDAFLASDKYRRYCDRTTLGNTNEYLSNRLYSTLTEGIEIGRRLQLVEDMEKLRAILERD